ncbi:cytochrome P450 [Xylariaceae sp. FL0016]|nr:cytochrome P450 [Xylariaceae sp. FL0016]
MEVLNELGTQKVLGLGLAAFVLWYITSAFYSWWRLRHIPGPLLASFSYLWLARNHLNADQAFHHADLRKYGTVVRTGPNYVITHDPMALRRVTGYRSGYARDVWYTGFRTERHDSMLSQLDSGLHDRVKAKVANGYNGRDVDLEKNVNQILLQFLDLIREQYISTGNQTKQVDFATFIRYFTLDVITKLGYGTEFGFLEAKHDLFNYTKSNDDFFTGLALALDIPLLRRMFTSPLTAWLLPQETDKTGLGKIVGITHQMVKKRFKENDLESKDMIGSFMRHGLTEDECNAETILQLLAGSDSTAIALRVTMLYIITTPRVYQRLKAEIRKAVQSGVSFPITQEQAKKIPYLQAVLKEGLRMRPPFSYGQFKVVPAGGETIDGVHIPAGTALGTNLIGVARYEAIFGRDVDLFRPERFLECDESARLEMERGIDTLFGSGRFLCAGKQVAFMEMNKVYFELLRAFDFQIVYPHKAWAERSLNSWSQKDMWVSITVAAEDN